MPFMQAFVEDLNARFNRKNIDQVDERLLEPGKTVGDAARQSQKGTTALSATQQQVDYINKFPAAELEDLRAVLYKAVTQDPRLPVQFLWVPGDAYRVEIYEVPGTAKSLGGVSVLLTGPAPG